MVETYSSDDELRVESDSQPFNLTKSRFDLIFREGLRAQGANLRLFSLPGSQDTGFATTRKIGCHARRNRQKRRAKSAWDLAKLVNRFDLDFVILVNSSAPQQSFEILQAELEQLHEELIRRWEGKLASG